VAEAEIACLNESGADTQRHSTDSAETWPPSTPASDRTGTKEAAIKATAESVVVNALKYRLPMIDTPNFNEDTNVAAQPVMAQRRFTQLDPLSRPL
jgi:hypothetical protein